MLVQQIWENLNSGLFIDHSMLVYTVSLFKNSLWISFGDKCWASRFLVFPFLVIPDFENEDICQSIFSFFILPSSSLPLSLPL